MEVSPDREVWQWRILAKLTAKQACEAIGRDDRTAGWYSAHWVIPLSLTDSPKVEGRARNEQKARVAARRAFGDIAYRLALKNFDEAIVGARGYAVEVDA